jgi:hypothetical protein
MIEVKGAGTVGQIIVRGAELFSYRLTSLFLQLLCNCYALTKRILKGVCNLVSSHTS